MSSKKRIAVIGGGLGSMTTLYNLMSQPNAAELYDITVYQLGWRIGGKGASGANPEKNFRVEEHGVHFWFGFYENAFRMMRDVYGKLERPPGTPLATFEEAFKPQPYMVFTEKVGAEWVDWTVDFPKLPGQVGDGTFNDPIIEIFTEILGYIADKIADYFEHNHPGCLGYFIKFLKPKQRKRLETSLESELQRLDKQMDLKVAHQVEKHLRVTAKLLADPKSYSIEHIEAHLQNFAHLRRWLWDILGEAIFKNTELRRLWETIDLFLAVFTGMFRDKVIYLNDKHELALDFSVINNYDFVEWLVRHGAESQHLEDFPPVKSMYDGPFAFFRGNVRSPNIEAGTALNIMLRLVVTCKEDIMWRMEAGMGETIFVPIYELFKKEFPDNIHWKFFHKAKNIQLSADKKRIAAIEFDRQVNLKEGLTEYNPVHEVPGCGLHSWYTRPDWEQLNEKQAKELQEKNINLESGWSGWEGEPVTIRQGEDFDLVIIGASLASLNDFCPDLIEANPDWARMLDKVGTVQTQAFQLWMTQDPQQMGVQPEKILSTYTEPLDTFAEMNQVLNWEQWGEPEHKPRYVAYMCGVTEDAGDISPYSVNTFPETQREDVYQQTQHFIENHLRHILPGAFDENNKFKWEILVDPENRNGPDRLRSQYYRANIDTSERYVLSLVGSSKHRLKTDESGFENLYLTGDWIKNDFNIGFVEGAVSSGIYTARAISGNQDIPLILPW